MKERILKMLKTEAESQRQKALTSLQLLLCRNQTKTKW